MSIKLGDVHADMERFLRDDCYCPGEIYDLSGFFFQLFDAEDECEIIERSKDMTAVVVPRYNKDGEYRGQAVMFWHDDHDNPSKIVDAQRVDATENNISILRDIVNGIKPDGRRKIDEFTPGSTAKALNEVMSISDAVMVN